jgi:hypothetical protein
MTKYNMEVEEAVEYAPQSMLRLFLRLKLLVPFFVLLLFFNDGHAAITCRNN